jgi:hypothetical protein
MAEEQTDQATNPFDTAITPQGLFVGGDLPQVSGTGDQASENPPAPEERSGVRHTSAAPDAQSAPKGDPATQATEGEGANDRDEAAPAPEQYADFTLPEGVQLDEAGLTEFKSFAKEQDLTQEQAQKVLEYGGAKIKAMIEAPYKTWSEMQTKWQAEVKADPEIGGTKFEQSIKETALVFQPGESNPFVKSAEEAEALRKALDTTGAGNNPAMVRLFVKMGRLLAEPGTLTGKPTAVDKQGDILAKMYPTMNDETK